MLDFGIAKILDTDVPGLTRHDVVCGTPQYMAPEQATGSALDERSDLYALGIILYQMTTGHLPFDGANSMEVLTRHVNEPPVPPRQRQPDAPISEPMERLILRALEKDPAKRPQTAEQFGEALLAVPAQARAIARATTPSRSAPVPRVSGPGGPKKPQRVLWLAAAATAVLLVLGVAAGMRRPRAREAVPLPPPPVADTRRDSATAAQRRQCRRRARAPRVGARRGSGQRRGALSAGRIVDDGRARACARRIRAEPQTGSSSLRGNRCADPRRPEPVSEH